MNAKRWSLVTVAIVAMSAAGSSRPPVRAAAGETRAAVQGPRGAVLVDGSQEPSQIPDALAYRVFFQLVRDLDTQGQHAALRAYLRRGGIGKPTCTDCDVASVVGTDDEIAAIIKASRDYTSGDARIMSEHKVRFARARTAGRAVSLPSTEAAKEQLVASTLQALQTNIGADTAVALDSYVLGHVKSRIRLAGPAGK